MEQKIFGVINKEGCLIDTSLTEQGAKNYATRHSYKLIGYRVGYNAKTTHQKIGGKWKPFNSN